jgi:hypothetical protein
VLLYHSYLRQTAPKEDEFTLPGALIFWLLQHFFVIYLLYITRLSCEY